MHRLRPKRSGGVRQHLQPCSRRTVRHGQKKDGFGAVVMEEAGEHMFEAFEVTPERAYNLGLAFRNASRVNHE